MFLLVLNEHQSRAFLGRPWLTLTIGGALLCAAVFFDGLSVYLITALSLPILECALRFGSTLRLPRSMLLPTAIIVLFAHAVFLAFIQGDAAGMQKLSINIAYLGTVLLGAGIGALIFRQDIILNRE